MRRQIKKIYRQLQEIGVIGDQDGDLRVEPSVRAGKKLAPVIGGIQVR